MQLNIVHSDYKVSGDAHNVKGSPYIYLLTDVFGFLLNYHKTVVRTQEHLLNFLVTALLLFFAQVLHAYLLCNFQSQQICFLKGQSRGSLHGRNVRQEYSKARNN